MHKVFIKTYGCQMNERDSEQVAQMFLERGGYAPTDREEEADVILINTCSVRDQAEQKALGKMGLMARHRVRKPHVVFGYLGCMAQSRGAGLFRDSPHVDLVAGTQKYHKVVDYVDDILRRRLDARMDDVRYTIADTEEEAGSQNSIRDHQLSPNQGSAFVSIMQGCNMKCTFCIVPYTRGAERSRPIAEITEEVRRLADRGIKEVTLLGQIVNLYGRHEFPRLGGRSPFVQLLEAVHEIPGIQRIRFTSPHPIGYKEDVVEAFRNLPKLCSHVHLPLQSGSDRILRAMHRPYKAARFEEICEQMREARPDIALTTDMIVGFPGETEEDYLATRSLAERIGFDNAFIFRYSKRKDTPAAELPDELQLPERVKEQRNQDLLDVINRIAIAKNEAMVGQMVEVLCEGPSKTNASRLGGRTSQNKPVVFDGPEARLGGKIFDVKVIESTGFTLYGDPMLAEA